MVARDGLKCVLCVDADGVIAEGGVAEADVDAAHIVLRDSPRSDVLEANCNLLSSWDVHSSIMLCRRCHRAFDRGLWHVNEMGEAVVAEAATRDTEVGAYWRARHRRPLRKPTTEVGAFSF